MMDDNNNKDNEPHIRTLHAYYTHKHAHYNNPYIKLISRVFLSKNLTIFTRKNLCFTEFSTKNHWKIMLVASDDFHMLTQSIKFF